jgi:hypothetical protein
MKILFAFTFFLTIATFTYSQSDPEAFLSNIPPLPDEACSLNDEERSQYSDNISRLHKDITEVIRKFKKEAESNAKNTEDEVKKNMAAQYGLTEADLQKMKNRKNMTEAEKKELMEKMMKAGNNNIPDQKKSKNMVELANEQKALIDKLGAINKMFSNKLLELDKKDTLATGELNKELDPLIKELHSIPDGEGSTDADELRRKNVLLKISDAEKRYCSKMTPPYFIILKSRVADVKSSLPDYKRLQEVNSELNKSTTGVQKDIAPPRLMELEAVEEYIKLLKEVFKYRRH